MSKKTDLKVQQGLEIIRHRPGQFVGNTQSDDYNAAGMNCIREILYNSIDEASAGHCNRIWIQYDIDTNAIIIRDNGRGIPNHIHADEGVSNLYIACFKMYAGGKYENQHEESLYKSAATAGLHGVGLSVVNALSSQFRVVSTVKHPDGTFTTRTLLSQKGVLTLDQENEVPHDQAGTTVRFILDKELIKFDHNREHIVRLLKDVSYLNPSLTLHYEEVMSSVYEPEDGEEPQLEILGTKTFYSPAGIVSLIEEKSKGEKVLTKIPQITGKDDTGNIFEIAINVIEGSSETYFPYVNGLLIEAASPVVVSVRKAFAQAVMTYVEKYADLTKKDKAIEISSADVRSGVICVIKLLHQNPSFDSQTKTKLVNTDISTFLYQDIPGKILEFLMQNPKDSRAIVEQAVLQAKMRIAASKERERVRASGGKTTKGKAADNVSLHIYHPPLVDDPSKNLLYMFEGQSASGTLIEALKNKNPLTGRLYKDHIGVLSLKGMPLNALEHTLARTLENKELCTLVEVSGLNKDNPDDLSGLEFDKFVISSDEDFGGMMIAVLLVNFFAIHFPEVLRQGKLVRVETPLFELFDRKTKAHHFIYSDEDKNARVSELGFDPSKIGVTYDLKRNKGLGELGEQGRMTLVHNPRFRGLCPGPDKMAMLLSMLNTFSHGDCIPQRKAIMFDLGLKRIA